MFVPVLIMSSDQPAEVSEGPVREAGCIKAHLQVS